MDIESLIPHRGRMKLLDDVLELNDEASVTSARVAPRWPLIREDGADPVVLIEVIAQTAAVHISGRKKRDTSVDRRGWMVGIKSADFFRDRIPMDTVLVTTVKDLYSIDRYHVLEGEVQAGAERLCRVEIQVFRESDEEAASREKKEREIHE